MTKKVCDCSRCDAPVFEAKAHVCAKCNKELVELHEKAEALYVHEYALEVGEKSAADVAAYARR